MYMYTLSVHASEFPDILGTRILHKKVRLHGLEAMVKVVTTVHTHVFQVGYFLSREFRLLLPSCDIVYGHTTNHHRLSA